MKFFTFTMKLLIMMPTVLASDLDGDKILLSRKNFGILQSNESSGVKEQSKMINRQQFNTSHSSYPIEKQSDTAFKFTVHSYDYKSGEYTIKKQAPLKQYTDSSSRFSIYFYDDPKKSNIKNEDTWHITLIKEDDDSIITKRKKK
jgi:hypothetical protein